jgi:hypothetical protein
MADLAARHSRQRRAGMPAEKPSCVELIGRVLERYAERGVLRGYSPGPPTRGKASFKLLWHRGRAFELVLDKRHSTMCLSVVLPAVSPKSKMDRDLKEFVASRHSEDLPEHRRINPQKAQVRCINRGGNFSLAMVVEDGDYEYGTRKLIHLVHEIYLGFLSDGPYFDYMVETLDL